MINTFRGFSHEYLAVKFHSDLRATEIFSLFPLLFKYSNPLRFDSEKTAEENEY